MVYITTTCVDTYSSWKPHWENFPYDFTWLNDNTKDKALQLDINYTEDDIRKTFNFSGNVSKQHYWNSYGNRNIIWFYAHFRMMYYYTLNPNEDYYWFFDDDLTMDNWEGFLNEYKDNDADFISYFCFKNHNVESQSNIPIIDEHTHSNNGWFHRFPGDGDRIPPNTELFGSFFPIVRLSNKALATLVDFMKKGIYGYSEGMVPTMLNKNGLKLDTIFKNGSENKYNIKHKHTEVKWQWI